MRREEKISIRGFLVDQIPNSPNQHHKNCMAGSEENYSRDLGVQGLILILEKYTSYQRKRILLSALKNIFLYLK